MNLFRLPFVSASYPANDPEVPIKFNQSQQNKKLIRMHMFY